MPCVTKKGVCTDRHSDQGTTRTDEEKNTARIYFKSEKRKGTGRQEWRVRWGGGGKVQRQRTKGKE